MTRGSPEKLPTSRRGDTATAPFTTPRRLFGIALATEGRGIALTAATALLMLHSLSEAAIPIIIGATIDRAVLPVDPGALALWLGILVAVFAVLTISYQVAARLMVRIYGYGEQALRQLTLERLLRPRLSERTLTQGEALTFVTSDTYRVAGVAWSVAQQCATIAAIAGSALAMLSISPVATLVVFAATILMMLIMRVVSRPMERRGSAEQHAATEAGAVAADFMSGFRVLVGMGARGEAVRRYARASEGSRIAATAAGRSLANYEAVSAGVAAIVTTVLAGISAWFASQGQISVGQLVTVLGLAQFVSGSLAYAGSFPSNWIHKVASATRLAEVMNAADLLPEKARESTTRDTGESPVTPRTPVFSVPVGAIRRRREPQAVPMLSFPVGAARHTVHRGEMLGIRPPDSDSARALARLLGMRTRVPRGAVTLYTGQRAQDIEDLDPVEYRRRVLSVPHHQSMMTGTLWAAIGGQDPEASVRPELLEIAALSEMIAEVGGPDAAVGEAGRRLSGGQRQRIGLARALHAPVDILILDEPTSALDAVTEAHVARALAHHDHTMIVISTSPVLLAVCDRVIELRNEDPPRDHS